MNEQTPKGHHAKRGYPEPRKKWDSTYRQRTGPVCKWCKDIHEGIECPLLLRMNKKQ